MCVCSSVAHYPAGSTHITDGSNDRIEKVRSVDVRLSLLTLILILPV